MVFLEIPTQHNVILMNINWQITKITAAGYFLLIFFSISSVASAAEYWVIDAKHSYAQFTVDHVLVEKVTGKIPVMNGLATFSMGSKIPTSVNAVLDPSGVRTDDATRDRNLCGSDWFDVARNPRWTFKSTQVALVSGKINIGGMLTIHGVTVPVILATTILPELQNARHYHANTTVDRHLFGMTITSMDPLIGDDIHIDLDILFTNKSRS